MSYQIDQCIGNYRLVRLIGQGSFGSVYLAQHIHLQTLAAVKLLKHQVDQHTAEAEKEQNDGRLAKAKAAFLQEAQFIASLKHPHIVRVLEFGFEQGIPYLVTEYASNGTLGDAHPHGTQVPVQTVLAYVQQIAEGLHYAHEQNIIHRDLKPKNLLLDEHMQVLITDFGVAIHGSRRLTDKDIAGTLAYMAPEQLAGKPRRASDQYALGIMAYEWLAGTLPFHGSAGEVIGQHQSSSPPSLRDRNPNISFAVEQVVFRALAKDPDRRFASVQEFAVAFAQAVTTPLAATVQPVQPTAQTTRPVTPIAPTQDGRQTILVSQPPVSLVSHPLPARAPAPVMIHAPLPVDSEIRSSGSMRAAMPVARRPRWEYGGTPAWFHFVVFISWVVWFAFMYSNGDSIGNILLLRFDVDNPAQSWIVLLSSLPLFFGWGLVAGLNAGEDYIESIYHNMLVGIGLTTWMCSACIIARWGDTPFGAGSLIAGIFFPSLLLCILTIPIGLGLTLFGGWIGEMLNSTSHGL